MTADSGGSTEDAPPLRALPDPLRVMILERDAELVEQLRAATVRLGWESHVLSRPATRRLLVGMRIHALVVDPVVLGADPWGWTELVAASLPGVAVVVCAGPSTVSERVEALRRGVDDWLTKPYDPEEVIARVEAAVRRRVQVDSRSESREAVLAGELEIRSQERQAYVAGVSVALTGREFEVLEAIVRQRGVVVAREEIYLRVWGHAMGAGDRTVDVFVGQLRRKLGYASPGWSYIHTQFRIGYRFQPQHLSDERHDDGPRADAAPT